MKNVNSLEKLYVLYDFINRKIYIFHSIKKINIYIIQIQVDTLKML